MFACIAPIAWPVTAQETPGNADLLRSQLFAPAPRELARPLVQARRAMRQQDYRTAVELLGAILTSDRQEDYLQPVAGDPDRFVSIHHQAMSLLGQIPRSERGDYELRFSVTARQLLLQAVEKGDYPLMARVSRNYFFTEAGYNASMLLGHHFLEQGRPISASSYFSLIVGDKDARAIHDPEASLLLATCWLLSGSEPRARATLIHLAQRTPQGEVSFLGQREPMFTRDDQAVAWLVRLIGNSPLAGYNSVEEWLMFRGNTARNASQGTGFPLPFPRWYVYTINDPKHELLATEIFQDRRSSGQVLIPSIQPLAVGDTIIMRSLDRTIGIDFETGRRVWEFPAWHSGSWLEEDEEAEKIRRERTLRWHVDQRMWQDHLYGQFSSNGRYVFLIDKPGYADNVDDRAIARRGGMVQDLLGGRGENELKAVDLEREGAFVWEVGGASGGFEPQLAGCFFLGAPLPVGKELYVLGEIEGEIRLIVLDQATGSLQWSQQIVAIDSVPPVVRDRVRRLAGATPSCSDGILVCPTSATGLVAIDLATRSLIWGVRYPGLWESSSGSLRARRQQSRQMHIDHDTQSVDASVTIADGRVIVMPVESSRILCYDLLTGELLWHGDPENSGRPVEDGLYIGAVDDGIVVVVGQQKIRGLNLQTGETEWTTLLARVGQPSGRGFLTRGTWFMPTDESRIVAVDVQGGEIVRTVKTDRVLGNLICYKGDIISQGVDVVSAWRQTEPVRKWVEESLANGDTSAEVLVWLAQLQAQDGDLLDATKTADQAWRAGSRTAHRLLMDMIIDLMEADFEQAVGFVNEYHDDLKEHRPARFLAARFRGLVETRRYDDAISLLSEFGASAAAQNATGHAVYRQIDDGVVRLRLDLWMRHHLAESIANVAGENPERVLREWFNEHATGMPERQLASFADWLGSENLDGTQLIRIAAWQVGQKEYLEAERTLEIVNRSADEMTRVAGEVLKASLFKSAGWHRKSARVARQLFEAAPQATFLNPINNEESTISDWYASDFGETTDQFSEITWDSWRYGRVTSNIERSYRSMNYRNTSFPQCLFRSPDSPDDIRLEIDWQGSELVVRDSLGAEIGRVVYKPDEVTQRYYTARIMTGNYALHGHLLIFSFGYDLAGIDLHRLAAGQPALLWQKTLQVTNNQREENILRSGYSVQAIDNPWGVNRVRLMDHKGKIIGNFASNSRQVFYRIGDTLYAIDASSGEQLWQRHNAPDNGWLSADDDHLVVLAPNRNQARGGLYGRALVLDASTGTLVKRVDLDEHTKRTLWHSIGTKLVFSSRERTEQSLMQFDLVSEQMTWQRTWPRNSLGNFRDPATMVIVDPDGKLEYLDLISGKSQCNIRLDPDRYRSLDVMTLNGHDLLLFNRDNRSPNSHRSARFNLRLSVVGSTQPLFNGSIYCVDRQGERLAWKKPLRVEYFTVPLNQPHDLPLMTMIRQVEGDSRTRGATAEFYTIDLRDGRLANTTRQKRLNFRTHGLVADPVGQTIRFDFGEKQLVLEMTDRDIPPTAPASLTSEFTLGRLDLPEGGPRTENTRDRQQEIIDQLRRRGNIEIVPDNNDKEGN
ncbi:MAG: PQQ-binding-like beta-propeller repeat protein [Pirellulaceae bacterium]